MNGKRQLTVEHIDKLSAYFALPHTLFFESSTHESVPEAEIGDYNPISPPPPTALDPFREFVNQMDIDVWRDASIKRNTIAQFRFNNGRLRHPLRI